MRIAMFSECYEPVRNGVVVSVKTFRRELQARGHTVYVFTAAYRGYMDQDPYVYRFASVKLRKEPDYPVAIPFRRLPRDYPELGVEIVHSQSPFTMGRLGARAAERHDTPLVYTFHTMITEYTHYVPLPQGLARAAAKRVIRSYCARADWVVAPTGIIRDYLIELGVKTPIAVVPTGVELPAPSENAREATRQRFGIPQDVPLVISVGRLAKEKRVDFLFRAFARVAGKNDAYLLFLGGGPWARGAQDMVDRLGLTARVRLPGFVEHCEVADCLAAADLFAYASTTDTQAIVVVEALAAGLPCVAVRAYGPSEVILDGRTGLLSAEVEEEFAEKVAYLLENEAERRRMSGAARERAKEFTPAASCDKLLAVYESAIGGRSGVKG